MEDDSRLFGELSNWYWYESQESTKIKEQNEKIARWNQMASSRSYQEQERERIEVDKQEAQNAGYQMASAFMGVFVMRTGAQASVILKLASKFAMWEGYRDLETGQEYMSGFLSAVFDAQPKQLKSAEE